MFILLYDENEVKFIVIALLPNKIADHDDILLKVVKSFIYSIVPQLDNILNKSLLCGILPNDCGKTLSSL